MSLAQAMVYNPATSSTPYMDWASNYAEFDPMYYHGNDEPAAARQYWGNQGYLNPANQGTTQTTNGSVLYGPRVSDGHKNLIPEFGLTEAQAYQMYGPAANQRLMDTYMQDAPNSDLGSLGYAP
jgi:hypothetical protein